jgi:predicted RNase H-like HicB family nuclease
MKYAFPAIFTEEDVIDRGKVYTVEFPDILGCITEGESIPHAMEMAREALTGCLLVMREYRETIPEPTPLEAVHHDTGFVKCVIAEIAERDK